MAVLTESGLIQIRRHLHEIPELALQEKETHDYLLEVIKGFNSEFLTVKVPEELPTAILVLIKGSNPQRTIGYRILMRYQLRRKQIYLFRQSIQELCMPVVMIFT